MSEVKLVELLTLDKLEEGLFRGQSWDLGFRALFGGQVLGQALAAAQLTLPEGRITHSFHSYFLLRISLWCLMWKMCVMVVAFPPEE